MEEIEFVIPEHCDLEGAEKLIEEVCSAAGLQVALKGSLSTYPGCIHWHYKLGTKHRGTLELTLFMAGRRIWANVQSGRKAPWIDDVLPKVRRSIESGLRQVGLLKLVD
jgi:hypothetical protein